MMRILVTGHRGYIGNHLSRAMSDFVGCDYKDSLSTSNDFANMKGRMWDVVIHLAAYVSVHDSFKRPDVYMYNNAWSLIPFISNNDIGKFIFASTGGALYGNSHAAKEEDAKWENCRSPYAQSKFMAEGIVRKLAPNHTILRLANVVGGDTSVRGEATVHHHFSTDNPIMVFGGEQTRDFVNIDQIVFALMMAANSDITGTYNIGSGHETTVMDLARDYSASRCIPLKKHEARCGEVDYISLDCTKAKAAGLLP